MLSMQTTPARKLSLKDVLFMPLGCLISLPPAAIFGALIALAAVGSYLYFYVNIDLFGIGAPPFKELTIHPGFTRVDLPDGGYLSITYELPVPTTFTGLVRHASPIRLDKFPILTHDILVTSGDYADPDKVVTSVSEHHFTWIAKSGDPQGKIHLLHTVPASEEIYRQLLDLRKGQQVRVTGREILKLEAFDAGGASLGWWQDSGCNTLLVTSVELLD